MLENGNYDDYTDNDIRMMAMRMHFNSVASIVVSAVTFFLIIKYSTPAMGKFKFFLLNVQASAFLLDFCISFITVPFPMLSYATFCSASVLPIDGHNDWGQTVTYLLMHLFFSYVGWSLLIATMYRYLLLCQKVHFLLSKKFLFLYPIVINVYPIPALLFSYLNIEPRDKSIANLLKIAPKVVNFFTKYACRAATNNITLYIYLFSVGCLLLIVGFLCAFFSYKTRTLLISHRHSMTAFTYKMHIQLLYTVLLQFILPFTMVLIPMIVIIIFYIAGYRVIKQFGILCFQFLAFHSSCNGLVIIFTVAPYRKAFLSWFRIKLDSNRFGATKPSLMSTTIVIHD